MRPSGPILVELEKTQFFDVAPGSPKIDKNRAVGHPRGPKGSSRVVPGADNDGQGGHRGSRAGLKDSKNAGLGRDLNTPWAVGPLCCLLYYLSRLPTARSRSGPVGEDAVQRRGGRGR